ncbi:MAG: hypothetical protein ACPLXC_02315 [Candidatus Pacearchaeota archaeon]
MVVYVRLEPYEVKDSRKKILDIKEQAKRIQDKAISFSAMRSEKKKSSLGIITRTRALEQEIIKLIELLPKLETVKAKERLLGAKEIKESKERETTAKKKTKFSAGKKTYKEELEEIRRKIEGLR